MNISIRSLLCCVALGLVVSSADADEITRRLSPHRFETASWNFIPAYPEGSNLTGAIVAMAKPDAIIGDNLHTILFMRTPGGWDAYSWRTATPSQALMTAKMVLNIPDEDNDLFGRPDLVALFDPDAPRPPLPYVAGMLTDDPLFNVVQNSETPGALVDMLVSMGYSAASVTSLTVPQGGNGEGGGEMTGCVSEAPMLTAMAQTADWAGVGVFATEAEADLLVQAMAANLFVCADDPDCTAEQLTPWASTLSKGECYFAYVGRRSEPRIDENYRWSCMYELRRRFTEYRSAKFRKADCTEVTCYQKRVGYKSGQTIYCMIAKPDATAPVCSFEKPSNCPTPNLGEDPTCRAENADTWGQWTNEPSNVPCP